MKKNIIKLIVKHPGKALLMIFVLSLSVGFLLAFSFKVKYENGMLYFELEKKELEVKQIRHNKHENR